MKCPKCKERTEVLETAQRHEAPTRRRRRCLSPACQHRFTTAESSLDSVRQVAPGDLELELRKITGKRRGYDPEALAAAISVDRRKRQIALEQRRLERYDDDDAPPHVLNKTTLRLELEGY